MTLTNVTLSDNTADGNEADGGGIYIDGGALVVTHSTITRNVSDSQSSNGGGGVYIGTSATATIADTAVSHNASDDRGGGMYVAGTASIEGCIVTSNAARTDGGGIYVAPGASATLVRTVVAGNTKAGWGGVAGSDVSWDFDPDSSQNMIDVLSGSTGLEGAGQPAPPRLAVAKGRKGVLSAEETPPAQLEPVPDTDQLLWPRTYGRASLRRDYELPSTQGLPLEGIVHDGQMRLDVTLPRQVDEPVETSSSTALAQAAVAFRHAGLDAVSNVHETIAGEVEGLTGHDTWIAGSNVFETWLKVGLSRSSDLRVPLIR